MHTSKTNLRSIAAIDSQVINYQVLDLSLSKDLFYVFAARKVDSKTIVLEMIQIYYDTEAKKWQLPAQITYELSPL